MVETTPCDGVQASRLGDAVSGYRLRKSDGVPDLD
jgi:hypothetical protein